MSLFIRNWTPDEDETLKAMALAGRSVDQIAAQLQRSRAAVYARASRFNLSLRRLKPPSKRTR